MINRVYALIYAEERGEIGFGFFRHPVYCFRVFVNPGKTLALAYYIYIYFFNKTKHFILVSEQVQIIKLTSALS